MFDFLTTNLQPILIVASLGLTISIVSLRIARQNRANTAIEIVRKGREAIGVDIEHYPIGNPVKNATARRKGKDHLYQAFGLIPEHPAVQLFAAELQLWDGNPEKALKHTKSAIRQEKIKENLIVAWRRHGSALLRLGWENYNTPQKLVQRPAITTNYFINIWYPIEI